MSKFSLREALAAGSVPELDTARREQIEYIDIDRLQADARNFYEISGVDELAASIELLGLQQPIRVRQAKEAGYYIIVSGHRRKAALGKLVEEGRGDLRHVPCIVESGQESAAWQELRLIYANSDTRKMSNADIAKQADRIKTLLYQLKEEGVEFPGRMRDHVAEACQISRSKLARLEVIGKGLISNLKPIWENGTLPESNAYRIAQESDGVQMKLLARHGTDLYKWTEEQISRAIDRVKQPTPEKRPDALPARQAAEQYLQELEAENERFLEAMRLHGYDLLVLYLSGKTSRREGIEALKRGPGLGHRGGSYITWRHDCMPQHFTIQVGSEPAIKRSWTEVYDVMAVVALERAEAAQSDRLPDADKTHAAPAQQNVPERCEFETWADALNEDPAESGLYWVITGPLSGGGKLYWWNAEESRWEHPATKCSLTVNAKAWMPCPELPEGLQWNREEL